MTDANSSYKWAADPPLANINEDKLSRSDFAKKVAWGIYACEYDREGSLVIGIHGDWGTGKTTLKNFILKELKDLWLKERKTKLPVVEFNPWQLSNQDKVLEGFFEEVGSVFNSKYFKEQKKDKELAKIWRQFGLATLASGKVVEVTALAVFVITVIFATVGYILSEWINNYIYAILLLLGLCATVAKKLSSVSKAVAEYFNSNTHARSLNEAREHLRDELKNLQVPTLVVIDDLDRLTKEEIKLMVQLVKANANFPNIIYLLLFQKDVVAQALEGISGSSGVQFLEKNCSNRSPGAYCSRCCDAENV